MDLDLQLVIDRLAELVKENKVNQITDFLSNIEITEQSFKKYVFQDSDLPYTRNLVTSWPEADLLILVWSPNAKSAIHDHANANCVMKILKGEITENRFNNDIHLIESTSLKKDDVAFISDDIGLHEMVNSDQFTISLHLYFPPYATTFGCNIFTKVPNEHQFKPTLVKPQLYSDRGHLLP